MKRSRTVAISLAMWAATGSQRGGLLEVVLAAPGDGFVEKGEIAGRFDVVAQRLQRPDDDVAMRLLVLDGGIGFEHEPLRPVALLLVLLGENGAQNLLGRSVMLERQEELERTLADVARAPRRARILLEAMRRREVDHGVVRQPREDRIDGLGVALCVPDPNAAGNLAPGAIGSMPAWLAGIDVSGIFRGQGFRALRIRHRSDHGEDERFRRASADRRIGAAATLAVGVQQFIAADGFDLHPGVLVTRR